ncbi:MAG: isoamylase early set domain-containing protein [Euryarchaeota archaeon]|nr:isoamylase early set domain-containing protein [Euryarchaeota archaeon]
MAKAKAEQKIKLQKVTFSFEAVEAREVFLLGDFNNWDPTVHPMVNDENSIWKKTVMIPPGKHEYKFLADGQWTEDPRNDQTCPNCFGTYNSVLNLAPK